MSDQFTFDDREDVIHLKGAWQRVLNRLKSDTTSSVMERILGKLSLVDFDGERLVLSAPGAYVGEKVATHYRDVLTKMLSEELGKPISLTVRTVPRVYEPQSDERVMVKAVVDSPLCRLIDRYRFETFIVGDSNRLAYEAARAVAAEPGTKYNPLFLHGTVGLGKTHLMHAIAHEVRRLHPGIVVLYITAQQFLESFVEAHQNKRIDQFRRLHRNVGLWLLDDVQLIQNKDRTQEEVFHTFNYLHETGKQIVVCADKPPRELFSFEERLRSRFQMGLIAEVQLPDTALRAEILRSKALHQGIELSDWAVRHLACHLDGDVRLLEGALTKLISVANIEKKPVTDELVGAVVDRYFRGHRAKPSLNQIIEAVSAEYGVPVDQIKGPSRKAPVALARHVAVFIARKVLRDSWKHLGTAFGNRDHTSMMHAYKKVEEVIAQDPEEEARVESILQRLRPMG